MIPFWEFESSSRLTSASSCAEAPLSFANRSLSESEVDVREEDLIPNLDAV